MPECLFEKTVPVNPTKIVAVVKKAVEKANGTCIGDEKSGNLDIATPLGPVRGTYTVSDQTIRIEIEEKPSWIACSAIESKLDDVLKQAMTED